MNHFDTFFKMIKNTIRIFPLVLIFTLSLSAGCKDNMGDTYPATVKVTMDGKPLEGASILLTEVSGSRSAAGITDASGVASIKSTEGGWGGVFPGEYDVVIKKTERTTSSTPPPGAEVSRDVPPEDQVYSISRELLPAKYGNAKTSGLKVSHANKKEHFEFDLSEN